MVMVSGGGGNAWAKEMTIRKRIARMCAPAWKNQEKGISFFVLSSCLLRLFVWIWVQIQQDTGSFPYSEGLQRLSGRSGGYEWVIFPVCKFVTLQLYQLGLGILNRVWFFFQAFNLIEGINVEEIDAKIARYESENAEQIFLSRAKRVCASLLWSSDGGGKIPVKMFYSNLLIYWYILTENSLSFLLICSCIGWRPCSST